MKASRRIALLALAGLLTLLPGTAMAQTVCMVSALEGQAALTRQPGKRLEMTTFRKLLPGDRVELPAGSRLRLSYLAQNRAEEWTGPAELAIETASAREATGRAPVVTSLGLDAGAIKDSPVLSTQGELVAGQLTVRGAAAPAPQDAPLDRAGKEELRKAQAERQRLAKALPPGDAAPQMVYLAALERLGQRAAMAALLEDLLAQNGPNPALESLLAGLHAPAP
ncbi:hypothetical protein NNJEOMEG_02238 [Fundidesulfovibrio magnetotacticus]|uniref:Uncharacterized protein n=1 Tax=Fundidesulfovibrio magnetotacticus TaxID=2730080 RepID=A0A6V8LRP7_9BACT|nr:hypothetical protein [Fundidesulfovibrio magnetotacticus]GFK94394.1 hypothetical protein NNJEOMEG_02238 [Fundidesulfovibrio magnetotacticus]